MWVHVCVCGCVLVFVCGHGCWHGPRKDGCRVSIAVHPPLSFANAGICLLSNLSSTAGYNSRVQDDEDRCCLHVGGCGSG